MKISKWNELAREYEDVYVSDNWVLPLYSDNMNEVINCVNCGKKIRFGEGYTSKRYHNCRGLGYYECEECYKDYLPIYLKHAMEIA